MNFVEKNGSKIAAALCVASSLPVVATIYAQGNQPDAQPDNMVNGEARVAKGWQEIEGKSWFFKENGSVDKDADKVSVATVSTTISDNVSENIVGTTKQYVEEINSQEAEITEEVIYEELEAPVSEAEETVIAEENTYVEEVVEEAPVVEETPVVEEVIEVEEETPVVVEEEVPSVEDVYEEDILDNTPIYEEEVEEPVIDEPIYDEPVYEEEIIAPPVYDEPIYEEPVYEATSTGQAIADAAMGLIGVTNGWQCTEVATQALINAGVQGVPVCWPDQYQYYGTVTYEAQVGALAYYYNGGRGVDHIAVYVGDGMCVHGNFDGQTIYYSEVTGQGSPDYYIVFE
ncbi:MAG: hypothetical protein Q4C49_04050 [Bacillota bacterium]|nr:hypothetical protein [Bacillota bacterium]